MCGRREVPTGSRWVSVACHISGTAAERGSHWRGPVRRRVSSRCYVGNMVTIERTQTGFRMERGLLKVLKGLAEYHDVSLGDLVEAIVLHAFEGKSPFGPGSLTVVDQLKAVYGVTLTAADAHHLVEDPVSQNAEDGS
jgi:hypothetical protein